MASKYSSFNQRMVFDNARALLADNGYSLDEVLLTQSTIRTEVNMATGTSQFALPLLSNNQGATSTYGSGSTINLLKQTDVAVVFGVRVMCAVAADATGPAGRLFSWGSRVTFTNTNTGLSVDQAYCNGFIRMSVDKRVVLPYWDLSKHWRVQETQQVANAYYATTGPALFDSIDGSADTFIPVEGNFIITGNSDVEATLNVPGGMTAVESNSRWVVFYDCLLAQNASKIANNNM